MTDLQLDTLRSVISAAQARFPDLEFVAPEGILDVDVPLTLVERLRIELAGGRSLQLQSVGVAADGVDDVAAVAAVRVSSSHEDDPEGCDSARLLNFDAPSGRAVRTGPDKPSWLEVSFTHPLSITGLALRNVAGVTSPQVRGITILAAGPGDEPITVYDGAQRGSELFATLEAVAGDENADDVTRSVLPAVGRAMIGDYRGAKVELERAKLTPDATRQFKALINESVLEVRSREWTVHGPKRSFRFWDEQEKVEYIKLAVQLADDLKQLTRRTCFGFGAVLAVVRDGDVIPHDDDLDLIVGFEEHQAADLRTALRRVERFLRRRGYTVSGTHAAHRQVRVAGGYPVDVFVGIFEGDTISWYPGARGALTRQMMYPTSEGRLRGVVCPLPRSPLMYLESIYGPGWRHPDPGFKHTWDRSTYADLVTRPVVEAGSPEGVPAHAGAVRKSDGSHGTARPPVWRRRVRRALRRAPFFG